MKSIIKNDFLIDTSHFSTDFDYSRCIKIISMVLVAQLNFYYLDLVMIDETCEWQVENDMYLLL